MYFHQFPAEQTRQIIDDLLQAIAVAEIAADYLNLPFNAKDLSALPLRMIDHTTALLAAVRQNADSD